MVVLIQPKTQWEEMCLSCATRDAAKLRRFDVLNDVTKQQVMGGCLCVDCLRSIDAQTRPERNDIDAHLEQEYELRNGDGVEGE